MIAPKPLQSSQPLTIELQSPCKLCHKYEATPGLRTCPTCRGEVVETMALTSRVELAPSIPSRRCATLSHPPSKPRPSKPITSTTPPRPTPPRPTPPRPTHIPLTGISLEAQEKWEQARAKAENPRKAPYNKKPRETVKCACGCGKSFERVIGGYWESRQYYNIECKRRHFKPNFGGGENGCEKTGGKPEKFVITPEGDDLIRKLYAEKVGIGRKSHVKALAEQLGVPPWKVSRRASALGVLFSPKAEAPWSDEELASLKENAHWSPVVIARNMRKAGFHRSATAIKIKMTRLGGKEVVLNGESFTSRGLGRLFGVDSQNIVRWIEKGLLIAERAGTARTAAQHGDIWRIKKEDVRRFVVNHVNVVDFRKLTDRWWFVELLAGKGGER